MPELNATDILPISTMYEPDSVDEVQALVRMAGEQGLAVYPMGGGTSLDYGLPARADGIGISMRKLNQVIDYPSEDMTITVEAGMTMANLAQTLAQNRQRLPIDAPQSERATLGGVIATNFSGPRRYGCGTMRDYVIGIEAVDARGDRGGARGVGARVHRGRVDAGAAAASERGRLGDDVGIDAVSYTHLTLPTIYSV